MIKLTIKKIFRNKTNIIMTSILMICSLVLICVLTFEKNYIQLQRDDFDKNVNGRTLVVSPSKKTIEELSVEEFAAYKYDYESILAIKHVQAVFDSNLETLGETTFENDDYDGFVNLRYGNEATLPNNIKGEKFNGSDTEVAICPRKFYPDSKEIPENAKYIDGESLLNTTFNFKYKEYDAETRAGVDKYKTFKIIGLYDNTIINETPNTCFVSARDLQEIYEAELAVLNNNALMSINVIVDDIKNLPYVKSELEKLQLQYKDKLVIDVEAVTNLRIITYTSIVFVIIMIIGICITFLKKRNIMNSKEIGLYSSLGFSCKHIHMIYIFDMLVIATIAFISSMILSLLIYLIILKSTEVYFLNVMYQPKLFVECYIIVFLVIYIFPLVINYIFTKKSLNNSDSYLMKEDK